MDKQIQNIRCWDLKDQNMFDRPGAKVTNNQFIQRTELILQK